MLMLISNTAYSLVTSSSNWLFEDVTIEHTGGYGIWLDQGSYNNSIQSSLIQDLGAGGVRIGNQYSGVVSNATLRAEGNIVNNSVIQVGSKNRFYALAT